MFGFEVMKLNNPFSGADVYYRHSTGSTMVDAERFASCGVATGTVVAAGFQSSGKGRIGGRVWNSQAAKNLLFTVLIKRRDVKIELNLVPLMAGCSVSSIIEEKFQLPVRIKWPNDVLIREKKNAGILCSIYKEYVLIGIGINCNQLLFPEMPQRQACSIAGETGSSVDIFELLSLILSRMRINIQGTGWLTQLHRRLYKIGERIGFLPGDPDKEDVLYGVLLGVDANGCLILYEENQKIRLYFASGEIR